MVLRCLRRCVHFVYGAITLSGADFQPLRLLRADRRVQVLQPRKRRNAFGLGWSPFARHYLGSHYCFPFHRVLRCFSSPGWPLHPMFSDAGNRSSTCWVVPFGNPRIDGYLLLPAAYRSLSRPSSPSRAKASTMCPSSLDATLTCVYESTSPRARRLE